MNQPGYLFSTIYNYVVPLNYQLRFCLRLHPLWSSQNVQQITLNNTSCTFTKYWLEILPPSIGYKYRNGPREYISTLILNCMILRIHRSRTTIKRLECFQLVATRHWPFQSNAINFFAIMV